jgi:hypothetical protein
MVILCHSAMCIGVLKVQDFLLPVWPKLVSPNRSQHGLKTGLTCATNTDGSLVDPILGGENLQGVGVPQGRWTEAVVCNLASRKTDLQGNLGSHVIRFGRKETRVRSTSTGSLLEEMCMPSSNRKPWCQFRLHMCLQKCQSPLKRHWTYLKPHGPIGDWNSMVPLADGDRIPDPWSFPRSLELCCQEIKEKKKFKVCAALAPWRRGGGRLLNCNGGPIAQSQFLWSCIMLRNFGSMTHPNAIESIDKTIPLRCT